MKTIKITLLSDLCCYSGEVYNSTVDIDCVYDKYGIPYIPAKRIKGCVREAALELTDIRIANLEQKNICKEELETKTKKIKDMYSEVFGEKGDKSSIFSLSNARINNYHEVVNEINNFKNKDLCEQQKVLNLFTYTRTQTTIDEETGSAKENSLRTMRVVKKGLEFYADLGCKDNKYDDYIEEAVGMVKHMGLSRTRGLGLVKLEIVNNHKNNCNHVLFDENDIANIKDNDENTLNIHIPYTIKLKSPVICKTASGNQTVTEDYISGSKVLGIIAGCMGDTYKNIKDKIIVSNAYIAHENERYLPARKSLYKEKNKDFINNEMTVYDMLVKNKEELKDMQITDAEIDYISLENHVKKVEREISYHHKRPNNKSYGHVINNEKQNKNNDHGEFYQLASISEGQTFKGNIYINNTNFNDFINKIKKTGEIRIGYGKNSGFGEVDFSLDKIENTGYQVVLNLEQEKDQKNTLNEYIIVLVSDAILYNDKGMPTPNVTTLTEYFKIATNDQQIKIINPYLAYNVIGGFNVTWGTNKQVFQTISKGTVFNLITEKDLSAYLGKPCFMGERIVEGFGEIIIYDATNAVSDITLQKQINALQSSHTISPSNGELEIGDTIKSLLEKELHKEIERSVREWTKSLKLSNDYKPALSKIRLLCKTQDSYSDMEKQIIKMKMAKSKCCELIDVYEDEKELKPKNGTISLHERLFKEAEKTISKTYFDDENKYKVEWDDQKKFKVIYGSYIEELKYKIKQDSGTGGKDNVQ